jgi:hypothetical protein
MHPGGPVLPLAKTKSCQKLLSETKNSREIPATARFRSHDKTFVNFFKSSDKSRMQIPESPPESDFQPKNHDDDLIGCCSKGSFLS